MGNGGGRWGDGGGALGGRWGDGVGDGGCGVYRDAWLQGLDMLEMKPLLHLLKAKRLYSFRQESSLTLETSASCFWLGEQTRQHYKQLHIARMRSHTRRTQGRRFSLSQAKTNFITIVCCATVSERAGPEVLLHLSELSSPKWARITASAYAQ